MDDRFIHFVAPDAHRAREDQHPEGAARHLRCVGFVISNGYRGDYATWDGAIRRNVMIGTIEDIREIAAPPIKMIEVLRSRAGFKQKPSDAPIPRPSRFRLGSWNIELTV